VSDHSDCCRPHEADVESSFNLPVQRRRFWEPSLIIVETFTQERLSGTITRDRIHVTQQSLRPFAHLKESTASEDSRTNDASLTACRRTNIDVIHV
jgi:hypothetical protein